MNEELAREDVLAEVDRAVEELLTAAGNEEPPVDCILLARRHLGWEVCIDRRQPQRGRAQRALGRPQIFLRPEPTEERHQWTVAHEIGEHMKPTLLARLHVPPEQTHAMAGESLANLFAHRLLVPGRSFAADAPATGYDLLALKERFRTASHEVIALRFLDLPAPCIITVLDNDVIRRRRSNAWRVPRKLAPAEERCRRAVHVDGRPHTVQAPGWSVQGWPVHGPDWKREILRSVIDADQ